MMQRRKFLAVSAAAAVGMVAPKLADAAGDAATASAASTRLIYEVRTYHFASVEKQKAYAQFLAAAAVAACNRAGVDPVGVFELLANDNPKLKLTADSTDLYVLLPHKSFEAYCSFESRLQGDGDYQKAGQGILDAPKADPAYMRYDSLLLLAMETVPGIAVPAKSATRLFELRTYESPTNERALNKLDMFNKGEIPIFARVGMPGVFFGGAIAGANLPQLTYMIVHSDSDAVKKDWNAFGGDAEWKKLNTDPVYKDNVSKVINLFLRPIEASQI